MVRLVLNLDVAGGVEVWVATGVQSRPATLGVYA